MERSIYNPGIWDKPEEERRVEQEGNNVRPAHGRKEDNVEKQRDFRRWKDHTPE